jgi:CheY-like chemotaxis protein
MGVPGESGGPRVAKILVADDNSNVQKTMALALADLGVEVVSVNNGEAAVRKLADIAPDLVLADIFMPVRNGYEVCEYIKKDARFSRVPVVLLVGAFDPLDEREAQRVGADGILKKPFVPPDPLIAMVKTLLDRSMGERMVAVSLSKVPVAGQAKAGSGVTKGLPVPPPPMPVDPSPEEFPLPAGRVSFGEGERPVAFGQLLESPARSSAQPEPHIFEPVDDEQILTSSRDATLGEPVFWRNDSAEVEPEAEHSSDDQDDLSVRKWGQDEDSLARREGGASFRPVEPLELVREEQEEPASKPSSVDSGSIVLDQAEQSPLTVEAGKAPDLAANPLDWLATAPVEHPDAGLEPAPGWDLSNFGGLDAPTGEAAVNLVPALDSETFTSTDLAEPSAPAHSEVAGEPDTQDANAANAKISPPTPLEAHKAQAPEDTARSMPVQKWAELTDILESHTIEQVAPHAAPIAVPSGQVPVPTHIFSQPAEVKLPDPPKPTAYPYPGVPFSPAPTLPPATSDSVAAPPNPAQSANLPAAANISEPATPDPVMVEAVVQRVLDKMRPQVVEIITKEFLRPVIQALVQKEIEKQ